MSKKLQLNGTQLKTYAIFAMLLDHIGLVLLGGVVAPLIRGVGYTQGFLNADLIGKLIVVLYYGFRMIGRTAFPIFCFLISEGLKHTKNRFKYLLRLFVFALISEVPFDLAICGRNFYMGKQNVFFTLFGGALLICVIEWLFLKLKGKRGKALAIILSVGFTALMILGIKMLHTDYSYRGVLLVLMLYLFRHQKSFGVLSCAFLLGDKRALLSFIPLYFYNGERGRCPKLLQYGFYAFYPMHLTLLYLIYIVIY